MFEFEFDPEDFITALPAGPERFDSLSPRLSISDARLDLGDVVVSSKAAKLIDAGTIARMLHAHATGRQARIDGTAQLGPGEPLNLMIGTSLVDISETVLVTKHGQIGITTTAKDGRATTTIGVDQVSPGCMQINYYPPVLSFEASRSIVRSAHDFLMEHLIPKVDLRRKSDLDADWSIIWIPNGDDVDFGICNTLEHVLPDYRDQVAPLLAGNAPAPWCVRMIARQDDGSFRCGWLDIGGGNLALSFLKIVGDIPAGVRPSPTFGKLTIYANELRRLGLQARREKKHLVHRPDGVSIASSEEIRQLKNGAALLRCPPQGWVNVVYAIDDTATNSDQYRFRRGKIIDYRPSRILQRGQAA